MTLGSRLNGNCIETLYFSNRVLCVSLPEFISEGMGWLYTSYTIVSFNCPWKLKKQLKSYGFRPNLVAVDYFGLQNE